MVTLVGVKLAQQARAKAARQAAKKKSKSRGERIQIEASLDPTGTFETRKKTSGGRTTTTILHKKTGQEIVKEGSVSLSQLTPLERAKLDPRIAIKTGVLSAKDLADQKKAQEDKRRRQLEAARRVFGTGSPQVKELSRNMISPPPVPKGFIKKVTAGLAIAGTPRKGEKGPLTTFKKVVFRGAGDITTAIASSVQAISSLYQDATAGLKTIPNDPRSIKQAQQSQARLRSRAKSLIPGLLSIGPAIGAQVQSNDPYEKVAGMTNAFLLIISFKGIKNPFPGKRKIVNAVTNYETIAPVTKLTTSTKAKTLGLLDDGTKVRVDSLMRYNPQQKKLFVNQKIITPKKQFTVNSILDDKGPFYVNSKTGQRIMKGSADIKDFKYNIKEITKTRIEPQVRTYEGNILLDRNQKIIATGRQPTEVRTITGGKLGTGKKFEVVKTIKGEVDFATEVGKQYKNVLDAKTIGKTLDVKTFTKKLTQQQKKDLFNIENILSDLDYDLKIINGLDRRTRLARALNLRKQSPLLKEIEGFIEAGVFKVVKREGKLLTSAQRQISKPIKVSSGFSIFTPQTINKLKKRGIKIPNYITIPQIEELLIVPGVSGKIRIPTSLINLGGEKTKLAIAQANKIIDTRIQSKQLRIPTTDTRKKILESTLEKIKTPLKRQEFKKILDKIKIPFPVKEVRKITETKKKTVPITRPKLKIAPKKKPKPSRPLTQPILPIKTPSRIPFKIRLTLTTKLPRGKRLAFNGFYRSKGRTRSLGIAEPLNKALTKSLKFLDRRLVRSIEVRITGITIKKDGPKPIALLKKVSIRKGKVALLLVEKAKHLLDTKGEKREIKRARRKTIKPSRSKKSRR